MSPSPLALGGLLAASVLGAGTARAGELTVSAGPASLQALHPRTSAVTHVVPSPGTALLGIPERFEPDVGLRAHDAWTAGFGARYTSNRRVYWTLDLGVPPRIEVSGHGEPAPPGPAGAAFRIDLSDPSINPLATQRQWSPAAGVEYRVGDAGSALRPFVSLGVTYTWFSHARLNPAFERALDERFGQPLAQGAGKPGPTRAELTIDPLWAPVVGAGVHYAMTPRLSLTLGAAWVPLHVDATLAMHASDESLLATTYTRSSAEGVVAALVAGYGWALD